jgi:prepilin-type N-terminal cleavage/methylation domain-containing protein
MKRGFTVIEILIAMMILFVAIGFVNISIKAFNNYQRKSEIYQNFYITALSLKDLMESKTLDKKSYNGILNGIKYKISVKEISRQKNYIINLEQARGGNDGNFFITLYQLNMSLINKNIVKTYSFYLTKQKIIHIFREDSNEGEGI